MPLPGNSGPSIRVWGCCVLLVVPWWSSIVIGVRQMGLIVRGVSCPLRLW